ncbi:MAG: cytochrome c oxidase assembly protein [Acidimicrobiia bacterium]|nr:cytochrome c oxidase assembly protein [Acidimicrobiia bacterium]
MLPPFAVHYDVMAVLVVLAVGYWWAERRIRPLADPSAARATRPQWWNWYSGVFFVWLASGWPMHDLAEERLFTAHMVEHMIIGYVVPPLLLSGMSRWLADATLGRLSRFIRPIAHPVVGFFTFNTMLVVVHWPDAVEWQIQAEFTHLLYHAVLFATAMLMWLPVASPTPAIPRLSQPMQMLYLFLNTLIPTVPASFLTFSSTPLYPIYGDGPSTWGLTLVADQTIAGIVMKLGGGFLLLGRILAIWIRYNRDERKWDAIERRLAHVEHS